MQRWTDREGWTGGEMGRQRDGQVERWVDRRMDR